MFPLLCVVTIQINIQLRRLFYVDLLQNFVILLIDPISTYSSSFSSVDNTSITSVIPRKRFTLDETIALQLLQSGFITNN